MSQPKWSGWGLVFLLLILGGAGASRAQDPAVWRLTAGDDRSYEMTQRMHLVFRPGTDAKSEITLKRTIDFNWLVEEADETSAKVIVAVRRVRLSVSGLGGLDLTLDTDNAERAEGYAALLEPLMRALCEHPIAVRISSSGEITERVMPEPLAQAFGSTLGNDLFKGFQAAAGLENLFLLGRPKLKGESATGPWSTEKPYQAGVLGAFAVQMDYTLADPLDGLTRISGTGTAKVVRAAEADAPAVEFGPNEVTGEVLLAPDTGRVQSSHEHGNGLLDVVQQGIRTQVRYEHTVTIKQVTTDE